MFGYICSRYMWIVVFIFSVFSSSGNANSPWGKKYFPNTKLQSHDGKTVKFFDDLIEDKIVVINFIYTSCPDSCPLETAQLTKVQNILGDRLGKDIYFYSISIDPDTDTPEVLKEYRRKFGAKWTFFTGDKNDIIKLRRKLGLYIENNPGGEYNHNVSMIIGNQKTGRWMKRSPFENPYVLADQIGNWLDGWKSPQITKDYANAPSLRNISDGEKLFRTRCMSCHSMSGKTLAGAIGPDLVGVTERRPHEWLVRWLREPDVMLKEKDPTAVALYEQFNEIPMPNMRLTKMDVTNLLRYMKGNASLSDGQIAMKTSVTEKTQQEDVLAVMNAWVREAMPEMTMNAGYMTLVNVNDKAIKLVGMTSDYFDSIELHEMAMVDGLMEMRELDAVIVPANGKVNFKPGGKHLMLKEPRKKIASGDRVDIVLLFDSGAKQTVSIAVKNL